jgi:uncharacterized protein (TIGR02452 family)
MDLRAVANHTLSILKTGFYQRGERRVAIDSDLARAISSTRAFSPEEVRDLTRELPRSPDRAGRIFVTPEGTIGCAARLVSSGSRVACLNFASARNPGGGFLSGARAQEEAICRASALYPTLLEHRAYYEENRRSAETTYTDWAIASPDVPVFRDDALSLLDKAFLASFITMPAPNTANLRASKDELAAIFERRIRGVVALGRWLDADRLVLGAWGCGAFRNDPRLVARAFHDVLVRDRWARHFDEVVFAILDSKRGENNLSVFRDVLEGA